MLIQRFESFSPYPTLQEVENSTPAQISHWYFNLGNPKTHQEKEVYEIVRKVYAKGGNIEIPVSPTSLNTNQNFISTKKL